MVKSRCLYLFLMKMKEIKNGLKGKLHLTSNKVLEGYLMILVYF